MKAVEVPELQAQIARYLHVTEYRRMSVVVMSDVEPAWRQTKPTDFQIDDLMESERIRMRAAHSFHCSEEMTAICRGAAGRLLTDRVTLSFEPETLPTELGFVVFDGDPQIEIFGETRTWPMGVHEVVPGDTDNSELVGLKQLRLPIQAVSWGPAMGHLRTRLDVPALPGIRFVFYSRQRPLEEWMLSVAKQFGAHRTAQNLGLSSDRVVELTEAIDGAGDFWKTVDQDSWIPQHAGEDVWLPVDSLMWQRSPQDLDPEISRTDRDASAVNLLTLMWTFFHMCSQTLTTVSREALPPRTVRALKKFSMPKHVTVVRLRRFSAHPAQEGDSQVEWSHRWVVRGHWRRQRVGPGRQEIRPTWIAPHVKGPDGAPLLMTEKVYALVR